ncbi:MAG: hypothetical protein KDE22_03740, partial [Rhodobacterales bacterium]|nr:hypothetical protein [Rhodobacterales bacterium]
MARLSQGRNRRTGRPGAFGMTTCLSLAGLVLVTSCAEVMEDRGTVIQENRPVSGVMSAGPQDAAKAPSGATDGVPDSAPAPAVVREGAEEDGTVTFEGTGQFLGPRANRQATVTVRQGQVVINFENAELRDVVRTILGDTLKVSYIYDPRVQGLVSLQTTSALPTEAVLGTLETILRMNGAALLIDQGVYKVVPADEAIRGNTVPELGGPGFEPLPPGYAVKVVPLQYISAVQMDKLLAPFVPPEGVVRVDLDRNLIILAGNSQELRRLMDTVAIFDVDWLAGMSVGIFPLAHVSPETLIGELDAVFGSDADGPLAGLVKLVPVKRLNALLVVSTKPRYLEEVQTWVDRLDKGTAAGQNLYVYYLNNGKATEIAKILADIFSDRKKEDEQAQAPGRLAPGQ